jgi:hypothetical protein
MTLKWILLAACTSILFTAITVSAGCYSIGDALCGAPGLCSDVCNSSPSYCRYEYEVITQFIQPKSAPNPPTGGNTTCGTPDEGTPVPCYTRKKCSSSSTVVCPSNPSDYLCQPGSGVETTVMKIPDELGLMPCPTA